MARTGDNIYKRKDGRYEGRYIKGYDLNGKAKLGYVYGHTYSEAKDKLAQCRINARKWHEKINSNVSLYKWVENWIEKQKQIKLTTKTMYYSHLRNHIEGTIGKIKLKNIDENIVQKFVNDLSTKYSPRTVHAIFSMLRSALNEAKRRKYISDVCSFVRLPKVRKKSIRVLTKDEQKRLENVISTSNNRYDIGILICLYTGIRIGELCALRWENIDLRNTTITIDKTVQRVRNANSNSKTKINFDSPKSQSSSRTIPIPSFLGQKLMKYKRDKGYILRDNGKFTDTRNISRRFKQLLQQADIDEVNFHILRHTFSTRALELGFDAKTLSEILGHSSVTTTLNLYAHVLPEHKKKEMEKLNDLYKNPSE